MKLKDITTEYFLTQVYFNQYMPRMLLPEPFATYTSVRALYTTWLHRSKKKYEAA